MPIIQRQTIDIVILQNDFFENTRKTFINKIIILLNGIRYLALNGVLEILEYDLKGGNARFLFATDGSEFISIPRQGGLPEERELTFGCIPSLLTREKRLLAINKNLKEPITAGMC